MKSLVLGLIAFGLSTLSQAQKGIAMLDTPIEYTMVKTTENTAMPTKQSAFVSTFENMDLPVVVKKMQMKAVEFNLESQAIFTPEEAANYHVEFNEGNFCIKATYDDAGILIATQESYKNVRMPYRISSQLAKNYPNWSFENTLCTIMYDEGNLAKIVYKVVLEKDGKKKTIKISG